MKKSFCQRFACISVEFVDGENDSRSRCWIQSIPCTRLVNAHAPVNMTKDSTAFSDDCVFAWMSKNG